MTTRIGDLTTQIEDIRFSAELNLATGAKAFRRALRDHSLLHQLAEAARDAASATALVDRVAELSRRQIDVRYENPFDVALCCYLVVLGDTAEPATVARAAQAVSKAPNCWWAIEVAGDVLMRAIAKGASAQPVKPFVSWPPRAQAGPPTERVGVAIQHQYPSGITSTGGMPESPFIPAVNSGQLLQKMTQTLAAPHWLSPSSEAIKRAVRGADEARPVAHTLRQSTLALMPSHA